ncbi:response regulator [Dankookia sp. P2]|uniref:response regulator n=1 Tax=Dankookia sp. P2 TaxID=3423955 RepID=UPI003D669C0E
MATAGGAAGHGLGLAMVRNFAERSGGTCRIERRPGTGTRVEILLPRADPEASEMIPEDADALDPRLHGGAAILLVDIEEAARARQAALLRDLGYTVAEAGNAEAAESLAHWLGSLDLVVTALELPGADGASLAARLRADRPALPVLFVTLAPPGPVLAGEAVLQRPVPPAALAEAVLELLQRRRSLRPPSPGMRLLRRLRTPSLRAAFLTWHAARVAGEALPRLANLDLDRLALQEHCVLVALDGPAEEPSFRFVSVGRALTDRLGHGLDGTPIQLDRRGNGGAGLAAGGLPPRGADPRPGLRGGGFRFRRGLAAALRAADAAAVAGRGGGDASGGRGIVPRGCGVGNDPAGRGRLKPSQENSAAMDSDAPEIDAPDLARRLAAMTPEAIDALGFGVIRLDAGGTVTLYSARERENLGASPAGDRAALLHRHRALHAAAGGERADRAGARRRDA